METTAVRVRPGGGVATDEHSRDGPRLRRANPAQCKELIHPMEVSLVGLSTTAWISRSIGVAARLGIADELAAGPATSEELARTAGADPEAVHRLLDALAMVGVFARTEDGRFVNSPGSEQLRTDHPESIRHWCMLAGEMYDDAWSGLLHTVTTGKPGLAEGTIYDRMAQDPEAARVFDLAMQDLTRPVAPNLARAYAFGDRARTVVDVGGGNGELLKAILGEHPHLAGICADRADVCERAETELHASGDADLAARLSYRPTDIFEECPSGGDLYIIKNVLHDWSPAGVVRILGNIAAAMRESASADRQPLLLVIEPLSDKDSFATVRALLKMVICEEHTREHSEAELREQAGAAGFEVRQVSQLTAELSVPECALAEAG
jgi:hypothetical protein